MGFNVNLYTLPKRDNSTKRPTGSGTTYSCVMKHGCGILNPTISLNLGLTSDPSQYNYAYIPAFSRYYFIEEWFFEDRLWTASLKVDVLATYKTNIGNAELYVMRAYSDNDGRITDLLYPARTGCDFYPDAKNNPWTGGVCYIVGVVSKKGNKGSMAFYAMTGASLETLCQSLTDPDGIISELYQFNETDASKGLQLSLADPLQYVKSCIAIPLTPSEVASGHGVGSSERVYAFQYDTGASGNILLSDPYVEKNYTFNLKKHPDTASRGNYVNSAPFTAITLVLPPFGCIEVDTSVTCDASTLTVNVRIDLISGKGVLSIECNSIVLNRIEAQIGVPISLSQVSRDYIGSVSSALGAVGGFASMATGDIAGGLTAGVSGIGNAVKAYMPRAQTIGTTGGFGSNLGSFELDYQFFRPVADDPVHNGRPLCQVRKLNTLSGYMMIQDGDVTINGTSTEDAMIRNYLEGGFYYE